MTVNERTKGYNGSLRAIQKSGGSRTLRDEESTRSSAEIRDKTIRRETGRSFRYYYPPEFCFFNILFTPQNTRSQSYPSFIFPRVYSCSPVLRFTFFADNINHSHESVQFHHSRDARNHARISDARHPICLSVRVSPPRDVNETTLARRHTSV